MQQDIKIVHGHVGLVEQAAPVDGALHDGHGGAAWRTREWTAVTAGGRESPVGGRLVGGPALNISVQSVLIWGSVDPLNSWVRTLAPLESTQVVHGSSAYPSTRGTSMSTNAGHGPSSKSWQHGLLHGHSSEPPGPRPGPMPASRQGMATAPPSTSMQHGSEDARSALALSYRIVSYRIV